MTTNQLFSKVIEIFRKHPEQVESINDDQGSAYSMAIFHPCPEIKSMTDLKDLNLTGFKVFLEEEKDRLRFKIYDIEFVSQRGSMPRWTPVTGVPFEQIIFKDDELMQEFYDFCNEHTLWKDNKEVERLEKLTDDFVNHETRLTFDDPFQTFIIERYKAEGGVLSEGGVPEAYQADDPNILDFTRE